MSCFLVRNIGSIKYGTIVNTNGLVARDNMYVHGEFNYELCDSWQHFSVAYASRIRGEVARFLLFNCAVVSDVV